MSIKPASTAMLLVFFCPFSALRCFEQAAPAASNAGRRQGTPTMRDEAPADKLLREAQEAEGAEQLVEAKRLYLLAIEEAEKLPAPSPKLGDVLISAAVMHAGTDEVSMAVTFAERALALDEEALGPHHPKVARDLMFLARFYSQLKNPAQAEQYVKRAVESTENAPQIGSFELISTLYGAAKFYGDQKMYAEAETLLKRAMELAERQPRPDESNFASLSKELRDSLVSRYRAQGKEGEAAALLSDPAAANLGKGGTNSGLPAAVRDREMGDQYIVQGKYPEAEECLNRAIALLEKAPEPGSPVLLQWVLDRLADVYHAEGRDPEALQFFERAFRQWEKNAQVDRSRTSGSARSTMATFALANFYRAQHQWSEMESVFKRGLEIQEAALGPDDLVISTILFELAGVYREEKKYGDALPLYPRILQIQESNLGQADLRLAITLDEYAPLLQDVGQESEAADMRARAVQIRNNKARHQANN